MRLLIQPRSARPLDMDIHLQSFTIPYFLSLMIAMSKPAYLAIVEYSPTKPSSCLHTGNAVSVLTISLRTVLRTKTQTILEHRA